jgi:hypothetical protein
MTHRSSDQDVHGEAQREGGRHKPAALQEDGNFRVVQQQRKRSHIGDESQDAEGTGKSHDVPGPGEHADAIGEECLR